MEFQPRENQVISLVMKLQNIGRTDLYGSVFVNVEAENFYRSIAAVYGKNDSFQVEISDSNGPLYSNFSPTGTVRRAKIEPYGITVSCSSGVNFAWIAFRQSCPALLIFLMTGLGFLTISIAMLKKIFKHIRNVFDEIHACVCLKKSGPEESRYREIDYFIRSFNSLLLEVDSLIRERVIREAEQKNAKLLSLQYQINPHFLFNMLEVFRMRLEALGDEEAADSVADFGNIMRYNISDNSKMTTLREEIDVSRRFVGLYRFKYKDSLSFSVKLEERLGEIKTLKFILQPIVENSIKPADADDEERPPFPDDADDPFAGQPVQDAPEDAPKAEQPNATEPVGFWPELARQIQTGLSVRERSFFNPDGQIQAVLRGDVLLLAADTEFVLGMVKKPAIEQLVREKAAAVLGRAVQVRFVLKTQLGSSGADPLDRLVAFGKEHSDIFTIK